MLKCIFKAFLKEFRDGLERMGTDCLFQFFADIYVKAFHVIRSQLLDHDWVTDRRQNILLLGKLNNSNMCI